MSVMFHISSTLNRHSIQSYGLDPSRMGAARGIAGNTRPEADGAFLLTDDSQIEWFARFINNTGGPVDVWQVDGVDADQLVGNGNGYFWLPGRVPANQVSLIRPDITRDERHQP